MQLGFRDPTLKALCNSRRKLRDKLGVGVALIVQRTLHSLDAAPTLADLSPHPPFSRRRLNEDVARLHNASVLFAIGAEGPARIVLEPDVDDPSAPPEEIDRITILAIGEAT